jgi:four helix bundle protein
MEDGLANLLVYQKARELEKAIVAILRRPSFGKFPELRQQMDETAARVATLISEGYGLKTDRQFAHFVFLARGEAKEMAGHLESAHVRGCISVEERHDLRGRYVEVAKMLGGLARHLEREDRKFRA